MTLQDKRYAAYYALAGIGRVGKTRAFLRARKQINRTQADASVEPIKDLGTAAGLSILPLVEFYPADERLAGESGVSYLVTVADPAGGATRILFDLGYNQKDEEPSPLMRNMRALGFSPTDLDAVFVSHCHLDHVGGPRSSSHRTFSLSKEPVDLGGIPAYVPTPMTHASAKTEYVTKARKLGEGVASTGPLDRAIWLSGTVSEHSLVVDVAGKGPVMIVGCGHPQLERLVKRATQITGRPLYGIVGGLHFPVTGSRVGKGGQTIIGNGKLPWQRITKGEARETAAALATLDLKLVALSAHDSCDWTLGIFQETLGDRYRTVKVGEEIVV
jgi:7,8-dihydropterin-6-yl-methyl-4-(beta-D-ribofuranosyl)aminobenzene 5'-phosphate synthase